MYIGKRDCGGLELGHVKRRDQECVGRKTLEKKKKTKAEMDGLIGLRSTGTTVDEVRDRTGWGRIVSAAATPQG